MTIWYSEPALPVSPHIPIPILTASQRTQHLLLQAAPTEELLETLLADGMGMKPPPPLEKDKKPELGFKGLFHLGVQRAQSLAHSLRAPDPPTLTPRVAVVRTKSHHWLVASGQLLASERPSFLIRKIGITLGLLSLSSHELRQETPAARLRQPGQRHGTFLGPRDDLPDNLVSSWKKSNSPGNENVNLEGIPTVCKSRWERQNTGLEVLPWPPP